MNREAARIVILEDALIQAQHTVEFLHACLTESNYKYAYPEQTVKHLKRWRALIEPPEGCGHSVTQADCSHCQARGEHWRQLAEARRVSGEQEAGQ
jgi:hypothetical protein